jgi:hypothetical protein
MLSLDDHIIRVHRKACSDLRRVRVKGAKLRTLHV